MPKEISLLVSLLRVALWNMQYDDELFACMDDTQWKKIMQMAGKHSVKAIAFDGVMKLPSRLQPSRLLLLEWAAYVDVTEKRYEHKLEVLQELSTLFYRNNIKMLPFKGFAMAQYYPVPEHREFGDIDIYLFGKHNEGNKLLLDNGARQDYVSYKHLCVIYKKTMIENHAFFLNIYDSRKIRASEKILKKIITDCNSSDFWIEFPVNWQALFYMFHAIHHFSWGAFSLRILTDLALFWDANKGKIDFGDYRKKLESVGLIKQADALTSIAVKVLGIDKSITPLYATNATFEEKILYNMLHPFSAPQKKELNVCEILSLKWNRFFYRAKSYELIYPRENYKRFISSVITNIKNLSFFK
ncbi:hypothetical protein FACS189429_3880 [Bacteroidia bacterium]|nr:hypothetical protein FACS189429_3880 [Bacteroidia bacterium]